MDLFWWITHGVVVAFVTISCTGFWFQKYLKPKITSLASELMRYVDGEVKETRDNYYDTQNRLVGMEHKIIERINKDYVRPLNRQEMRIHQLEIERNQMNAIRAYQVEIREILKEFRDKQDDIDQRLKSAGI